MSYQRITVLGISKVNNEPKSHLIKMTNNLVHAGDINAVRGKNDSISLAHSPLKIH